MYAYYRLIKPVWIVIKIKAWKSPDFSWSNTQIPNLSVRKNYFDIPIHRPLRIEMWHWIVFGMALAIV